MAMSNRMTSVLLITISIIVYSFYPIFAVLSVEKINPLLFVGVAHVVAAVAVIAAMIIWAPGRALGQLLDGLSALKSPGFAWDSFRGGMSNGVSHAAFVGSFYFLAPAVATVIYEIWPVVGMYMIYLMMRHHYRVVTATDGVYAIVAFIGYTIVVFSDRMTAVVPDIDTVMTRDMVIGVGLALVASVTMAYSSAMGVKLNKFYEDRGHNVIIASFLVQIVTKIWSGGVPLVSAVWLAEANIPELTAFYPALLAGILVVALGASTYIASLSLTRSSNITILYYITPVLSLIWIAAFGYDTITIAIAFGAVLIIIANLLISLRADPSASYTATLVALLVAAAYVYYVPGLADPDFYDAVAVPAGIFAILIAFLLNRLYVQEKEQEDLVIKILSRAESSPDYRGDLTLRDIVKTVAKVWYAPPRDLEEVETKKLGAAAFSAQFRLNLFELAVKRLSPVSYAERLVLVIIGAAVVLFALVFRTPNIQGDLIALSLTVAAVFLCAVVLDARQGTPNRIVSVFRSFSSEDIGQDRSVTLTPRLSAIMILVVFALFAAVLMEKYGHWSLA